MATGSLKFITAHMEVASVYSKLSHCNRLKVGALLVSSDERPLLAGYNGTSPGRDNCCEENDKTIDAVHHAEANLIGNAAKNGIATAGCTMYITAAPCIDCAKLIEIAGIKQVYFKEYYRSMDGVEYLESAGISINKIGE